MENHLQELKGAAENTDAAETTETTPKTPRSMSVAAKITAVVALCLVSLIGTNGFGIYQMQLVNYEIEGIADRDIPMTELLQAVTVQQLEQAISFERAIRFGEEMATLPDARPHYEKSLHRFEELSAKTEKELALGVKQAAAFAMTARDPAAKKEFDHLAKELKNVSTAHKTYELHVKDVTQLLTAGNLPGARKLAGKVEIEEEALNHKIEGLLFEVSRFTANASQKAKALEKFAIKSLIQKFLHNIKFLPADE
jgi:methyl-accepting chemotaxis protein